MIAALKVLKYELEDVRRSRGVIAYSLLLLGLTEALVRLGGGGARALLSLSSAVLLLVPLVSLLFGALYLYGAREFTELVLAQPIPRRTLFAGLYLGLTLPLATGLGLGLALPFAWHGAVGPDSVWLLATLLGAGILLTFVFTAIAVLIATTIDDRARGLGVALLVWLLATVVYDGGLLLVVTTWGAYPLERPLLALTILNPVDLARVLLLLQFDVAALMGYTGAVFRRFFGSAEGALVAAAALAAWVVAPLALAARSFRRKDF